MIIFRYTNGNQDNTNVDDRVLYCESNRINGDIICTASHLDNINEELSCGSNFLENKSYYLIVQVDYTLKNFDLVVYSDDSVICNKSKIISSIGSGLKTFSQSKIFIAGDVFSNLKYFNGKMERIVAHLGELPLDLISNKYCKYCKQEEYSYEGNCHSCHSSCKKCLGSTNNHCLSCKSGFLIKKGISQAGDVYGYCIASCPNVFTANTQTYYLSTYISYIELVNKEIISNNNGNFLTINGNTVGMHGIKFPVAFK